MKKNSKDNGIKAWDGINRVQRRVAGYLNGKTAGWSAKTKLVALVLFCAVGGGCCLFVLAKALCHLKGPPTANTAVPRK